MPFYPIRNDITCMEVDAIVNAANRSLLGGGGVDGAIHRAAGPGLLSECRTLGGCSTGDAKLTRGYDLPAKYVIHTVGPIYRDGMHGEETLLRSCYKRSLQIAEENALESIAFPLISAGVYGYPREDAIRIASEEIIAFLEHSEMTVYLVFYDRESYTQGRSRYPDLESRIQESQVREESYDRRWRRLREEEAGRGLSRPGYSISAPPRAPRPDIKFSADIEVPSSYKYSAETEPVDAIADACAMESGKKRSRTLKDALKDRDESFAEMLFRCIDARGMTDAQCYHGANIDKRLFSKIRSKPGYQPSKPTVIAFAVALKLDAEQTDLLLRRAGLALNGRDTFDIIVDYFISRGNYNIWEINETLFRYDQPLLGNSKE